MGLRASTFSIQLLEPAMMIVAQAVSLTDPSIACRQSRACCDEGRSWMHL